MQFEGATPQRVRRQGTGKTRGKVFSKENRVTVKLGKVRHTQRCPFSEKGEGGDTEEGQMPQLKGR